MSDSRTLWLRFVDVTVRVDTNDADVWAALRLYWAPYVAEPTRAPAVSVTLTQGTPDAHGPFEDISRPGRKRIKEAVQELPAGRLILKRQTGVVMGLWPGRALKL